jgi:hypothetical protein
MTKSFKIKKIKTTKQWNWYLPFIMVTVTLSSFAQAPEKWVIKRSCEDKTATW